MQIWGITPIEDSTKWCHLQDDDICVGSIFQEVIMRALSVFLTVSLLVALAAQPVFADPASTRKRDITFSFNGNLDLCNGDNIDFEATITLKAAAVFNDNGQHSFQISLSKNDWTGVSTITGQHYLFITTAPIIFHGNMDNGVEIEQFMFANSHWIAQGLGPADGIVRQRHTVSHSQTTPDGSTRIDLHFFSNCPGA